MENFNALLTLSELKALYSNKPVGICPLYKGSIGSTKVFETTGNPVVIPKYVSLEKLQIEFSPKQAGNGDPSPDNVRPISGWDSVKVTVSNESESHDYDVTFPKTIYGGTVDAVTGRGEKAWEFIEFDGTEEYSGSSTSVGFQITYRLTAFANIDERDDSVCSHFKYTVGKAGCFWVDSTGGFIRIILNDISSLESWKSYLATQASAGTPVQLAYKLATPESFKASQVSIPSLRGENNFFTNGENLDIIYKVSSFWG